MKNAWLIASLYPSGTYSLDVYSEETPTITHPGMTHAVLRSERGPDYAFARRALLSWMVLGVPREILRFSSPRLQEALARRGVVIA